jgi:predicted ester cyclase
MQNAKDCASLAREVVECFSAHDLARLETLFAENSETVTMATGERSYGPDGARADTQRWLDALPDMRFEIRSIIGGADGACVEATCTGTNTGPLVFGDETVPPTGRNVSMPACILLRFDTDGKVVSEHDYFDLLSLMEQLGLAGGKAPRPEASQPVA